MLAFIICVVDGDTDLSDLTRGMVGDINLFLSEIHEDEEEDEGGKPTPTQPDGGARPRRLAAEFNVMIADVAHRVPPQAQPPQVREVG